MSKQAVSDEITIKELFERIVALETKMDEAAKRGSRTEKRFVGYVLTLGVLILLDILISIALFIKSML